MNSSYKKSQTQNLSLENLEQAKKNASCNGKLGEEFLEDFFSKELEAGRLESVHWVSQENSLSPFDFKIKLNGEEILIDAKSTKGKFSRKIHISINELKQIALGGEDYHIYRIYEMEGNLAN